MKILRSILFAIIGVVCLVISFRYHNEAERHEVSWPPNVLFDHNAPSQETWGQELRKGNGASIATLQNTMSEMDVSAERIRGDFKEGVASFFFINGLVLLALSIPTNIRKTRKSER